MWKRLVVRRFIGSFPFLRKVKNEVLGGSDFEVLE